MIISIIEKAKVKLREQNIEPKRIKMSPASHQMLIDEIYRDTGKKHTRIFEFSGLKVQIDEECPSGAAYVEGI